MVPVIKFMKLYSDIVLDSKDISRLIKLKQARLFMNLGLREEGQQIRDEIEQLGITEQEIKLQQESIKGLMNSKDDADSAVFMLQEGNDPLVIESIKLYEIWMDTGVELLKWGEYLEAKKMFIESSFHSRVL